MRPRDVCEFLLLAALWGGSFILMRFAVPEFGPVPLIELRMALAGMFLAAFFVIQKPLSALRPLARPLLIVGILNSALPFTLFAFATLSLAGGFASILNATAPMFGAQISFLWLNERLSPTRIFGLAIGFGGVVILVWGKGLDVTAGGPGLAIGAALLAACLYGIAANYTRRRLSGVNALDIATGSQLGGALVLLPLAVWAWPPELPSPGAWLAVAALALACTALAYILYFRLIAQVGATRAIAVTYLIPVFGMFWGRIFLHEPISVTMVLGCAVILLGTALTTGLIAAGKPIVAPPASR